MDALSQLNTALSGRYEVEREIGAGGMATVFLARDLKHDRMVALKVLKPELGAVLGVERFLSEIRVTAGLQHPNLLPLFDSGEANGLLFYVMPFVEGESLRARLDREKQLPVDAALHIAIAVANALDYAHRKNVIHRDLKPENILMHEGEPLVADFGIALAVSNAGGNRITQTGLSLGTPQYMSPEQATGDRNIDGRTDIYSLAAVTYEMLTGDPPHVGSTAQAVIARVLTEKPRGVRMSRPSVPEYVETALDCALEKLPADRFATARDFAAALGGASASSSTAFTSAKDRRNAVATRQEKSRRTSTWVAVAALVALGAWGWLRPKSSQVVQRARFALTFPDSFRLREELPGENVAISPDGTQFVYVGGEGQGQLYVRPIDELDAHPIRGTEGANSPRFSPDGKWLAFVVDKKLKKVSMAGGPAISIADTVNRASWGDNDEIVFERGGSSRSTGLWRVSAGGGQPVQVTTIDRTRRESSHTWPVVLPGGTAAVFTIERGAIQSSELAAVRLSDGKVIRLGLRGVNPRYVSTGYLLYGHFDGTLLAAPFDARNLRVLGPSVTVLEDLVVKGGGAMEAAVSRNGTLVYSEGNTLRRAVLVDRAGNVRALPPAPAHYDNPQFSPTGDRIAFQISEPAGSKTDIWVYSLTLGTMTRLTRDGQSGAPDWTADGKRIAWTFGNDTSQEIRWQPSDGSGEVETLFGAEQRDWAVTFSPAGRFVAAVHSAEGTQSELYLATLDSTASAHPLIKTTGDVFTARFSPDGQWLAYASGGIGDIEVYVTAVSGRGGRFQISTAGGIEPVWAPDGHTLYYRTTSRMMAASVVTTPAFAVTRRDSLFVDSYVNGIFEHSYDISPDGKSFLMLRGGNPLQRAVVVFGWLDELRERMALAARK